MRVFVLVLAVIFWACDSNSTSGTGSDLFNGGFPGSLQDRSLHRFTLHDSVWKNSAPAVTTGSCREYTNIASSVNFEAAVKRHDASALVVNNKAYIIGAAVSTAAIETVCEVDPATGVRDDRTTFGGGMS